MHTRTCNSTRAICIGAVELVSVIEAQRSVLFVRYRGRESICRVHLCDWGIEIYHNLLRLIVLSVTTFTDVEAFILASLDLHANINIELLGMWLSCSLYT